MSPRLSPGRTGLLVMMIMTTATAVTHAQSVQAETPVMATQSALAGSWTSVPDDPRVQQPEKPSEGLYQLTRHPDGSLEINGVLKMKSPSWIASSPDGRFAWVTNEEVNGAVTALARDANGRFSVVNSVSSPGQQPTHAALSPDGRFLIVANYSVAPGGAGIAVFPVANNGALSESVQEFPYAAGSGAVADRQASGHAHSVTFSPDGSMLYVADLGADLLHAYRYAASKALPLQPDADRNVQLPPGSGPRHMAFSADGRFAWLVTEMSAEVVGFTVTAEGLEQQQNLPLYAKNETAFKSGSGIVLSPDGRWLLVMNRGADNRILIFRIDEQGRLRQQGAVAAGGIEPRALAFDQSGQSLYVANVFSNSISRFSFDAQSGELIPAGSAVTIPTATDIKFFGQ